VADARPILEFYAQLEARHGIADQLFLVDAERADEIHDRWNRGLADADGSDLFELDQRDAAVQVLEKSGQARGRHPAGGAAAHDRNAANSTVADRIAPGIGIASSLLSASMINDTLAACFQISRQRTGISWRSQQHGISYTVSH
jgi:hypothetical protein